MILKLILKNNRKLKRKDMVVWIQKDNKDFESDVKQLMEFFKESIDVADIRRFNKKYYKITSKNPAIMMSLFSAVHDLIPEVYFTQVEEVDLGEPISLEGFEL